MTHEHIRMYVGLSQATFGKPVNWGWLVQLGRKDVSPIIENTDQLLRFELGSGK